MNQDEKTGIETIEWKVFLFSRHPARGAMAAAVLMVTLAFVHNMAGSAWLTGLATFILLVSLSNFFLPTQYKMDATHVELRNPLYRRRRAWTEFRGVSHDGLRLKLRTISRPSRLDNYRGMLIQMDPDRGQEILDYARARIEEAHHGAS